MKAGSRHDGAGRGSLPGFCGSPPTSGSSTPCAAARTRPSRSSTRATTAACFVLPPHARLRRGGRGRRPAHVPGRLPRPAALAQADPPAAVALHDRPQPLPHRPARRAASGRRTSRSSRRPSTSRARSSAGTTCARCSATSPRSRPTSARRSCSPSSATCRTTRSATCSGCPKEKVKALVFQARSSLIASRTRARDLVRRDPRAAREPARRLAAPEHAAAPPARVPGLPRVPRPGRSRSAARWR